MSSIRQLSSLAVGALLFAASVNAAAQDASRFPPTELVKRPQTNSAGVFEARGALKIGLSKDSAGKPVVLAPSLYYGVTNDLMLGVAHENSFCLAGCDKVYRDVGLDALYSIVRGRVALSAHGGLFATWLDPLVLQLRAGALLTILGGEIVAFYLDPQLVFGLTNREPDHKEELRVPFRVAVQTTPQLAAFLDSGFFAALNAFGDTWRIPIGAGALYAFDRHVDLGAMFTFERFLAGQWGGLDARTLTVFVNGRF
jgi:hypothetical protein